MHGITFYHFHSILDLGITLDFDGLGVFAASAVLVVGALHGSQHLFDFGFLFADWGLNFSWVHF